MALCILIAIAGVAVEGQSAHNNLTKKATVKAAVSIHTHPAPSPHVEYREVKKYKTVTKRYKKHGKYHYKRVHAAYRYRYKHRRYGYTNGLDCWGMSDRLYSQLTSSGKKARVIQYASSMSPRHRSVQVYSGGKWTNYNYKANGYSQAYYATSGSSGGKVVK